TIRLEGLPGKPPSNLPSITKGADHADVPLKIPGNLAAGRYTVVVIGEATAEDRKRTNATPALTLDIQSRRVRPSLPRARRESKDRPMTPHDCRDFRSSRLTRRHLLRAGSLGFLGLNLPGLFRLEEAQAARSAAQPLAAKIKSCILLFYYGGPSHHDTWDMKPDAPKEVRGEFQPIATNVTGLRIA